MRRTQMPIEKTPISGRMYRHYKGGIYTCHGLATHTETGEVLVVYRNVGGDLYVRPLSVWNELVKVHREDDLYEEFRFELLPTNFKLHHVAREHNPPGDELMGDESGPVY